MSAHSSFRHDVSSLRRRLSRRPGDLLIPVLTLAIVIGLGASVFAVVNGTMLRPLPFPDEERLVRVFTLPPDATDTRSRNPLASIDFVRFSERSRSLDRLEVIWQRERGLVGVGDPVIVKTGSVSSGFFELLGGKTARGRTFTRQEDEGNASVAVLSNGLWRRAFGGDPAILGRKISLDGEPHVVIGVMAPDFQPAYRDSELWTPLSVNAHNMPMPNATYLVSVGRLAPGRSLTDARGELGTLMADLGQEEPRRRGWTAGVVSLRDYQFGERRGALLTVLVMVGLLIAVAGSNMASFTLSRTIARQDEFALRAHLGASRGDLFRLLCLEASLVYAAAAIGGLLLTFVGLPMILSLDPDTARALGPSAPDWRVQAATFGVAFLLACVSGVWPAVSGLRGTFASSMPGRVPSTHSRFARRFQAVLVGLQTAVAFTVLIVGGGLLESFWRTSTLKPGFAADDVLTAQVRLSSSYATEERRISFMDRLLEAVQQDHDIVSASAVSSPFIPGFNYVTAFDAENQPTADGQLRQANFRRIAPGYFATLQLPIRRGRDILASDRPESPWVAVVSQSLADQVWPGQDPIGHRVKRTEPGTGWMTIVGVVGDVKDVGLGEGPDPTLYVSQEQHLPTGLPIALVVRTRGRPAEAAPLIRAALARLDATQVVDRFVPMQAYLQGSLAADRFRTALVVVFGATGVLLLLVGLASVTARSVTERTREMGIRLALGAAPSRLWIATTHEALRSVWIGIGVGMAMAGMVFQAVTTMLSGVAAPTSGWWAMSVLIVVMLCAIAAGIPASRVAGVRAAVALRSEV